MRGGRGRAGKKPGEDEHERHGAVKEEYILPASQGGRQDGSGYHRAAKEARSHAQGGNPIGEALLVVREPEGGILEIAEGDQRGKKPEQETCQHQEGITGQQAAHGAGEPDQDAAGDQDTPGPETVNDRADQQAGDDGGQRTHSPQQPGLHQAEMQVTGDSGQEHRQGDARHGDHDPVGKQTEDHDVPLVIGGEGLVGHQRVSDRLDPFPEYIFYSHVTP